MRKIAARVMAMKEKGHFRFLGLSGHNRSLFPRLAESGIFDLFHVTSQKVRVLMRIGDELFHESLMICNAFFGKRENTTASRRVCILSNKLLKGRDFVGIGETVDKVIPEGDAQFPTCFL